MDRSLLILFGTVTGNAEICAERAADTARARGYDPVLENMALTSADVLTQFRTALVITSTYGDGDPPDGTEDFHQAVIVSRRLHLPNLRFSVLALGDSCYDQFCKCGRDYDEALEQLGATRVFPRMECDTDYDDLAEEWTQGVFAALAEERALLAA